MANTLLERKPKAMRMGLTLIEFLVVIAIIAILSGLLLPAINAARESGRRSSCQNNLHQLVLACHQFKSANRRYPPGTFGGKYGIGPDSKAWSWIAYILPQLEKQEIVDVGRIGNSTMVASGVIDVEFSVLRCSSAIDPLGPLLNTGNFELIRVGRSNYKAVSGANWGSDLTNMDPKYRQHIGTQFENASRSGTFDGLHDGDGVMWRGDAVVPTGPYSIRDGLSNTMMIGEDVARKNSWLSWPYANHAYGTCAIPPNYTSKDSNWWPDTMSFRSDHPKGLNFAFADGHVKFIEEHIEFPVYRSLATRAGHDTVEIR